MTTVLEVNDIRKSFGGITAVDGVSFDVQEGEILGLIGPNGCGKSTLFNCILGQLTPSGGEVKVDGKIVTGLRPSDLNRLGVSRTYEAPGHDGRKEHEQCAGQKQGVITVSKNRDGQHLDVGRGVAWNAEP